MNKYFKWGGVVVLTALIIGGAWFFVGEKPVNSFSIDQTLLPSEWQYKGLYTTPDQIAKIENNIKGFQGRTGATTEEKYDLAITIAQEYMRIGKGQEAYDHLVDAAKIDPVNSITYQTMGGLFESLNALPAAETALKKGIEVQPHIPQNHLALINFYKKQAREAIQIDDAFNTALDETKQNGNVLMEYGQWLEEEKRFADALSAWEKVSNMNPGIIAVKEKVAELKTKVK